jgi:hypothetical protein
MAVGCVRELAPYHAMTVKLRWYPDWRLRYIRDRAGLSVWIGPVGLDVWR